MVISFYICCYMLIKKLPEGVVLDEERIEDLTTVFPLQYLIMFEQMKKDLEKRD